MLVKKTKSGKLSVSLSFHQRAMLEWCSSQFLQVSQYEKSWKGNNMMGMFASIYYATINLFFIRTDFQLKLMQEKKILVTIPEGLAIMWMLGHSQDLDMINLKSALHKTLTK